MNTCIRILSMAILAWACLAAGVSAQVEPGGDLNLLVSTDLLVPPGSYASNDIVFRNRIGGMCFTATADIVALNRVGTHSFTLLTNGPGGSEALNANDLQFEMRTGPKLNLIVRDILFGNDLELGYMGVDGYSLSKTVPGGNSPLLFGGPLENIEADTYSRNYPLFVRDGAIATPFGRNIRGDDIRFDYISRFHSAEANLLHDLGDRFSLLAGFRYVDLHEQLDGTVTGAGLTDTRFITSNTDNHLYGFQLGGQLFIINLQKIHLAGIAKAGIFSNQSDLSLSDNDPEAAVGGRKGQLAFLGEVDLIGSYCITDNIAVRLGYQAMWLSGVALAVDQLDMSNGPSPPAWHPNTQGSLFYHGAFLGLEASF